MRTLHAYFGRELLKTFAMTSVALTLLVVLGGGVANIFKGEGIGAEEVVMVFALLTPVAVTLILPIAGLFSATITYGRAAADNEITACRAAGINIHRLLLSAGLLGLFITLYVFYSWNFMIPQLQARIELLTRKELPAVVVGQFQKAKPLAFGKYRIAANRCEVVDASAITERLAEFDLPVPAGTDREAYLKTLSENHTFMRLSGVTFLEVEDDQLIRYGTADDTMIDFDRGDRVPKVVVDLQGVRTFDNTRRQYYELAHQILGPFEVPLPLRRKLKFETLATLVEFGRSPKDIPDVQERLTGIRREMMTYFLAEVMVDTLKRDGKFVITGPDARIELTATDARTDPDDGRPELRNVTVQETVDGQTRSMKSETAQFELKSSPGDRTRPIIVGQMVGNVEIRKEPVTAETRVIRRPKEALVPLKFMEQPALAERVEQFDWDSMFDEDVDLPLPKRQATMRAELLNRIDRLRSEVGGEIHFRLSYALTAIAMLLFGAVMGIIVRGGQVLTAFGISCIPMVFVVVASIVGRNLADRPHYAILSYSIMWAATAFIYLGTGFIAFKFLKR